MKILLMLCCALLGVADAAAQQLPSVEELLPRIQAYARQYRQNIPSFEADEAVTSQLLAGGAVKKQVRAEMTMRLIRSQTDPEEMTDHYTIHSVNGKPLHVVGFLPIYRKAEFPYFVHNVFSNVIGMSGKGHGQCNLYRILPGNSPDTVTFELWNNPDAPAEECKDNLDGYHKTLLVERDSGRVLRVVRSMSAEAARQHHEVGYTDVEFASQKLGEESFLLPIRFTAHDGTGDRRITATYSNFHRYTSTASMHEVEDLPVSAP